MLQCNIALQSLNPEQLECGSCKKCIAKSKPAFHFKSDLKSSEDLVNALKDYLENKTPYKCEWPEIFKHPDIRVLNPVENGRLICRVEAKHLEGFAFMKTEQLLKDNLKPKETLVVDEPKLRSYFECKAKDTEEQGRDVPIFVVWKFDRPCSDLGGIAVFQEISELNEIYDRRGKNRTFDRAMVSSDMVAGQKRGITAKYHFSLKECRPRSLCLQF